MLLGDAVNALLVFSIVGVSVAASAAEPAPIHWVARGSYARRAGEQARWLPGLRVALGQYRQLEPPVTLADIRRHKNALLTPERRVARLLRARSRRSR